MFQRIAVSFLLLSCWTVCRAQDYRATLQGLVTDSSGAAVPDAQLTLLNVKTGVSRVEPANGQGEYSFKLVEPGSYDVMAEMTGFSKTIARGVRVEASGDVTINLSLQPGLLSQAVSVTADPVELQLDTSSKSLTLTQEQIANLPVQDRSPFSFAFLDPAVQNNYPASSTPFHMWQASEMDFGGRTSRQNDVLIDGSPVQIGPKGSYTPTVDATQDMVVEQVAVDAEYGHTAGGVINIATREGTNEAHGDAYYYGRNPDLNAATNALTHTPSVVRNNIWGGTLGGPIKKNKVFTFGSYEGWKNSSPYTVTMTLPTALERTGDYSQSYNINGGLRTIYNPFSTQYDPTTGVVTRTPFAGNKIPASMLDPTAVKMMSDIWLPNATPSNITGANNFRKTVGLGTHYWNVSDRTDWNVSQKLRIFGRYSEFSATNVLPDYTGINSPAAANGQGGLMFARNIGADAVYTINPTTVADFRFSYAAFNDNADSPQNNIGASGLASLWPKNPWYQPYLSEYAGNAYFPTIQIGPTGGSLNQFGVGNLYFQEPHSYNLTAKIAKTIGAHNLKSGVETRYETANLSYPGNLQFRFTSAATANTFISPNVNLSGNPYATFLLGAPDNSGSSASFTGPADISLHYYGAYIQDDYKVSRRLSVNVGLRYEFESAPVDSQNRYTRYLDLTAVNPTLQANPPAYTASEIALRSQYIGAAAATPAPNGQWLFATSQNPSPFKAPVFNFAPRVGAAFKINDKTVLQAGWGRFLVLNSEVQDGLLSRPNFVGNSVTSAILPSVEGVPVTRLSNPYPSANPLQPVPDHALGVNTNLGNGGSFRDQNYQDGSFDRFNVTLERRLPGQFRLDVSFVASNGRNLDSNAWYDTFPLNSVDPNFYYNQQTGPLYFSSVSNPFYHYLTPAQFPGSLRNQKTVPLSQLLAPYPQYGDLELTNVPIEQDKVRNLEVQVQRAYANGFTILGSYIYDREWSTWWPASDPTPGLYYYNQTPAWTDGAGVSYPRHRAIVSGVYDLPFGRGRSMLRSANRLVDGALGGWSLGSIVNINGGGRLAFNGGYEMAGNPAQNVPAGYGFNPAAFVSLPAYTAQPAIRTFPGVNSPMHWNVDANLSKTFPITERLKLQFRMEAYNLTNSIMWQPADSNYGDSTFGQTDLSQSNVGRTLQYAAKIVF